MTWKLAKDVYHGHIPLGKIPYYSGFPCTTISQWTIHSQQHRYYYYYFYN